MRAGLIVRVEGLARRLGADVGDVIVLRDAANVVARLGDSLVARVATTTATVRGPAAAEAMRRSVVVARHLAAEGIEAPRPSAEVDPGPHAIEGGWVTFWAHVDHDATRPVDPALAAERLRALHEATARLPADGLPRLAPLAELGPMVATLRAGGTVERHALDALERALAEARAAIDALGLPEAPIHGDASPGNLLVTPDGPMWSDFEDACVGPRAWDLACVVATGRAFHLPSRPLREAILDAYGAPPDDVLRPFLRARVVQSLVWEATIVAETGRGRDEARARRERWIRGA